MDGVPVVHVQSTYAWQAANTSASINRFNGWNDLSKEIYNASINTVILVSKQNLLWYVHLYLSMPFVFLLTSNICLRSFCCLNWLMSYIVNMAVNQIIG